MPLASLTLKNIGPFERIRFELDPQVNVFVGPNNSGKTTILLALADFMVQSFQFPRKLCKAGARLYASDATGGRVKVDFQGPFSRVQGLSAFLASAGLGWTAYIPALRLGTDYRSPGPGRSAQVEDAEVEKPEKAFRTEDKEVIQQIVNLDYRALREANLAIRRSLDQITILAGRITEGFEIELSGIKEDAGGWVLKFKTPDGEVPLV